MTNLLSQRQCIIRFLGADKSCSGIDWELIFGTFSSSRRWPSTVPNLAPCIVAVASSLAYDDSQSNPRSPTMHVTDFHNQRRSAVVRGSRNPDDYLWEREPATTDIVAVVFLVAHVHIKLEFAICPSWAYVPSVTVLLPTSPNGLERHAPSNPSLI